MMIVLYDDAGWTAPSSGKTNLGNGSDFHQTPAFDALADASVAFSSAYSSPGCMPGRAALLAGQHAARTKVYANYTTNKGNPDLRIHNGPEMIDRLSPEVVTIAEALGPAGYESGYFGKYHLGTHMVDGPEEQGFDLNVGGTYEGLVSGGCCGNGETHFAGDNGEWNLPNLDGNGVYRQFMADRLADETMDWIDARTAQPWLAFVSHFSVHTPIEAPQPDIDLFEALPKQPESARHDNVVYAAMHHNLDWNLGRLVTYLETTPDPRWPGHNLIENTVVMVFSDNGGTGGFESEGVTFPKGDEDRELTNQLPLRSGKGTVWEGGMRVPLLIRFDPLGGGGAVRDEPVQHVDLYATLVDLAGAATPESHPLDGMSLAPLLQEQPDPLQRDRVFFHYPAYLDYVDARPPSGTPWRERPTSLVWTDQYKLKWVYEEERWYLYDLDNDIGENQNIACGNEALVADLGASLVQWLEDTEADLPVEKGTATEVPLPDPAMGTCGSTTTTQATP